MRSTNLLCLGVVLAGGCAVSAGGTRGVTHREHLGSVPVIFTNATPGTMCNLSMSREDQRDMGDNWLPEGGLASGKSIEFKIKPGKYQATWNTCKDGDKPYFAGTLIGETSIKVDGQPTQLFTYVADTVAPTKRAPVLGREYHVVKFSGQPVGPIGKASPIKVDAFAVAEASLGPKSSAPKSVAATPEAKPEKNPEAKPEKFSAKEMVDPKARRATTKRDKVVRPSLDRKHDVTSAKVKYRTR